MTSSDNSKSVPPDDVKAVTLGTSKVNLAHCWWLAIGLAGKDIEIYYGWDIARDAGNAIFSAAFALTIVYILRWAFSK